MLLSCGKQSNTLTNQMVSTTNCISSERDSTFLASFYKYFSESLRRRGAQSTLAAIPRRHYRGDETAATVPC